MSTAHLRGARAEQRAARLFGVRRQLRLRFESKGDIELVKLPGGLALSVEVKMRAKLPRLIVKAMEQAKAYEPAAVPACVISELGGAPLLVLPLRAFCVVAGIAADKAGG